MLKNKELIAISQDVLGQPGRLIRQATNATDPSPTAVRSSEHCRAGQAALCQSESLLAISHAFLTHFLSSHYTPLLHATPCAARCVVPMCQCADARRLLIDACDPMMLANIMAFRSLPGCWTATRWR